MFFYFGCINYLYKDCYLFEVNFCVDVFLCFYKDNCWGWFFFFFVGWCISEELFMKLIVWLNNLKLRVLYGMLGNINNVGYYDYFELLSSNVNYNFNDELVKGVFEVQIINKILGWEIVVLVDFGLDVDLFDNKLSVIVDYYIKNIKDILLGYNVLVEMGIWIKLVMNLVKVCNIGFELVVIYCNKIGDLFYFVSGNIVINNNEIVILVGLDNMIQNGGDVVRYILKEGEVIGFYYGLEMDGLYIQEEIDVGYYYKYGCKFNVGDIKYVFQCENVEWGDDIIDDDCIIIGKDVFDFIYGININL